MKTIKDVNEEQQEREFSEYFSLLENYQDDNTERLQSGFICDVEFQPVRWFRLSHSVLENPSGSDLFTWNFKYPVFQFAAEIFLKGMWLCQYKDCRLLAEGDYLDLERRKEFGELLKKLGHDLLQIIEKLKILDIYNGDHKTLRFLKALDSLIRIFYLPVYCTKSKWADYRYPVRFYNDKKKIAEANNWLVHPLGINVQKLFERQHEHIENRWELQKTLTSLAREKLEKSKSKDRVARAEEKKN